MAASNVAVILLISIASALCGAGVGFVAGQRFERGSRLSEVATHITSTEFSGDVGGLRPRVLDDIHTFAATAEDVQAILRGEKRLKLTHQTWVEVVE